MSLFVENVKIGLKQIKDGGGAVSAVFFGAPTALNSAINVAIVLAGHWRRLPP